MQIKKKLFLKIFLITFLLTSVTFSQATLISNNNSNYDFCYVSETIKIEDPIISVTESNEIEISLLSSNSYTVNPAKPKIPIIKKIYTFPKFSEIESITCTPLNKKDITLNHPLKLTPDFQSISGNKILTNKEIIASQQTYPIKLFNSQIGAGITKSGEHVVYVSLSIHPIQYHFEEKSITFVSDFNVEIKYKSLTINEKNITSDEIHDLVIITPNDYTSTLNSFVNHKKQIGLNPLVKTTTEIKSEYQGRDEQEKIKYFIKDAIETHNTKYVLLIGDIIQLPIRKTDAYPWENYHGSGILTDLYYADIYDASFSFSSWDTNNNNIFGEVTFDSFPPSPENIIDEVDLYPDVHIGRIPCSNIEELTIVLSKIITYEQITAYQNWFQKIILAGGDTFPLTKGSPINVFEGEITNVKVGQQIPGFEQIKLWTSEKSLNARSFNQAISEGAGFLSYAGHGFEHGWGTYRPNAIIDGNLISYFTPFIKRINNEHRLPIIFFDACLTAKLDFNISDLTAYYGLKGYLFSYLLGFDNSKTFYPSFAWAIIKKDNGGGIATIGATRPAYTYVDKDGVYAGAGFLDVRFFHAYEEGVTVGEMLSQAQIDYQNYVGKDVFTIEEYLLFGDPSLHVGGYQ